MKREAMRVFADILVVVLRALTEPMNFSIPTGFLKQFFPLWHSATM